MTTQEIKTNLSLKAENMTLNELKTAMQSNQSRFRAGGDLELTLICNDVLNFHINKFKNK